MGSACLACTTCGHAWRAPLPRRPRLLRSIALAAPMVVGGAIGMCWNPAALGVVVVGAIVGLAGYRLCTPECPACGSERTLRTRFNLARDARVIEGDADARPAPQKIRFG